MRLINRREGKLINKGLRLIIFRVVIEMKKLVILALWYNYARN